MKEGYRFVDCDMHIMEPTDLFDSSFPEVSSRVLHSPSITPDLGGKILSGGARLYGFDKDDFARADAVAKRRDNQTAAHA